MPLNPVPKGLKLANLVLFLLNLLSAAGYMYLVHLTELSPRDRAAGIEDFVGPAYVWLLITAKVFAFYLILNLIWGGFIVAYRYLRGGCFWLLGGRLWLLTGVVWIAALVIDVEYQRGNFDWFLLHLQNLCR